MTVSQPTARWRAERIQKTAWQPLSIFSPLWQRRDLYEHERGGGQPWQTPLFPSRCSCAVRRRNQEPPGWAPTASEGCQAGSFSRGAKAQAARSSADSNSDPALQRADRGGLHPLDQALHFHGKRHPLEMGEKEVTQFLSALAVTNHVSASTQNQALCFFFPVRSWSSPLAGWTAWCMLSSHGVCRSCCRDQR